MLKFFRRIRKGLLESGKIRNYTFYAIGEIALVVIGILIALQINNWNEQKKEQAIANNYLSALKNELQQNITEVDRVIAAADRVFNGARPLFRDTITGGKPSLTEKEVAIVLNKALEFVQFEPQTGVINDIVNSGKTSLLKNDTLRNFISSWEGFVNQLQREEGYLHNGQDFIGKYIYEFGNLHMTGYYGRNEQIPPSKFERGNLPLLEMVAFEAAVSQIIGNSVDLRSQHYPQFKEKLQQQIAIIDRELE